METVRCCVACGREIPDWKTRERVYRFMADGIANSVLMESVALETTVATADEPQIQVTLINPLSGPILAALGLCTPVLLGSAAAFQYGAINGPLATLLMIGSFSALVIVCGSNPRIIGTTARQVEPQVALAQCGTTTDDNEAQENADEVIKPARNSLQIRFYDPPLRPSGVAVPWESICFAARQVLNNVSFSELAIAGQKGAKISGPDFRILSQQFIDRGYTDRLPDKKTIFTERGQRLVRKLAELPY